MFAVAFLPPATARITAPPHTVQGRLHATPLRTSVGLGSRVPWLLGGCCLHRTPLCWIEARYAVLKLVGDDDTVVQFRSSCSSHP